MSTATHECRRREPVPAQPHVEWTQYTPSWDGHLERTQVNLQLQPLRTARGTPQKPGPLMGLKQPGVSDTTAPQPIVPHQLQYMSSVWFVNHRIQWLFAWEAADRGLGGLARA